MNRQERQDRQEETPENWLIVLGALGVLGGSKKDFAVLLCPMPRPQGPILKVRILPFIGHWGLGIGLLLSAYIDRPPHGC